MPSVEYLSRKSLIKKHYATHDFQSRQGSTPIYSYYLFAQQVDIQQQHKAIQLAINAHQISLNPLLILALI
jgi:hypothetical protein